LIKIQFKGGNLKVLQIEDNCKQTIFDWLALERVPLVGPLTMAKLIEACGTPGDVLRASSVEIRQRTGLSERLTNSIALYRPATDEIEKDMALLERLEARLITRWGRDYPSNLRDIYDPPALLFVGVHCCQRIRRLLRW